MKTLDAVTGHVGQPHELEAMLANEEKVNA